MHVHSYIVISVVQKRVTISTMIAYDKEYCTIVFIMRCAAQNNNAMIASRLSM